MMSVFSRIKDELKTAFSKVFPKTETKPTTTTPVSTKQDDLSDWNGKTHTVMKGETLSHIALKYYGDAMKFDKIFEANRVMLKGNQDRIYPGQVLRIPE